MTKMQQFEQVRHKYIKLINTMHQSPMNMKRVIDFVEQFQRNYTNNDALLQQYKFRKLEQSRNFNKGPVDSFSFVSDSFDQYVGINGIKLFLDELDTSQSQNQIFARLVLIYIQFAWYMYAVLIDNLSDDITKLIDIINTKMQYNFIISHKYIDSRQSSYDQEQSQYTNGRIILLIPDNINTQPKLVICNSADFNDCGYHEEQFKNILQSQ